MRDGEAAFALRPKTAAQQPELLKTLKFIVKRQLFGLTYGWLDPDYFYGMPRDSGVYLCPMLNTSILSPGARRPGDIDLLLIPYEGDELILDRVMAFEIKIIRAKFTKQGRSPNEFGLSQARSLRALGFPFVSILHLIEADGSPREAWRSVELAKIIDQSGNAKLLGPRLADLLPLDLISRGFGRLEKLAALDPDIGLAVVYPGGETPFEGAPPHAKGTWHPLCRAATLNIAISETVLSNIVKLFEARPSWFFDNPRWDPV